MKLARVVGTMVATVRHKHLEGQTLLVCQVVDAAGAPAGPVLVAVDRAQAGVGDTVLVHQEGNGARQMFGVSLKAPLCINATIVGVVDEAEEQVRSDA